MKDSTAQWLVAVGFAAVIGGIFWVNAPHMGHAYDKRIAEVSAHLGTTDCEVCDYKSDHKYQSAKLFDDGGNICCGRTPK